MRIIYQTRLINWYQKNKRNLPWRNNKKDGYTTWISEMMLQQTSVKVVIPYYRRWMKRFPTLKSLAQAHVRSAIAYWSGLGYYLRVKNLHRTAQIIYQNRYFPKSYRELLKLPGLGPYTARAVSSLAFEEKTGVLDGNVLRVVCRYLNLNTHWWTLKEKSRMQKTVDQWVKNSPFPPSVFNQALMELGALICKPNSIPFCTQCPIKNSCQAFKKRQTHCIPLQKPKIKKEIWLWKIIILIKNQKLALIKNSKLPFLKNQFIFPGHACKQKKIPASWHITHSITHHAIYIELTSHPTLLNQTLKPEDYFWIPIKACNSKTPHFHRGIAPSSLIDKVLTCFHNQPSSKTKK